MKKDVFVSRAELVSELLAGLQAPAVFDAPAFDDAAGGTLASPARDAFVSRKLAIAKEILLRDLSTEMAARSILSSPDAVRDWLKLRCAGIEHEVFFLLHLDARNRLIKAEEIFRGTLTYTSVYPREVVKSALAHNAASVMLAHNHPSGDAEPSQADRLLTRTLASALSLVDVRVADHFIVAGNSILSFAEQGFL
jgi:DNA repair protein RadC